MRRRQQVVVAVHRRLPVVGEDELFESQVSHVPLPVRRGRARGSQGPPAEQAFWDRCVVGDRRAAAVDPGDTAAVSATIEALTSGEGLRYYVAHAQQHTGDARQFVRQQLLRAFQRRRQRRFFAELSMSGRPRSPQDVNSGLPSVGGSSASVSSATASGGSGGAGAAGAGAATRASPPTPSPPAAAAFVAALGNVAGAAALAVFLPFAIAFDMMLWSVLGGVGVALAVLFLIVACAISARHSDFFLTLASCGWVPS